MDALADSWRDDTFAANLDTQLNDDQIWLLLETMTFKDMRSFLQTQCGLVRFHREPNNYAHFLSMAKKRFQSTPGLFSLLNKDTRKDKDGTRPACLALINRASFYETHLQHIDADPRSTVHSNSESMWVP